MHTVLFDPFAALARFDRELDGLVRRNRPVPGANVPATAGFVPAVEAVRDGQDVVIRCELPGIDPEHDVSIEVDRGRLVISGERRARQDHEAGGLLVRELRYGRFRREFALPPGTSPEQIDASYDAGLLDVRVRSAVRPEPTPVRVPVTTGAAQRAVEGVPEQQQAPEQDAGVRTEDRREDLASA